ncbi:MAG: winged helix-turn-helix transcriptional regulator [Clostridia bacterium]|nr:winged helix-turn-helix transcriptional regulator [Clostridia bacterium]
MSNLYKEAVKKMVKVTLLHRYAISTSLSGMNLYRGQPEILEYLNEHGDCSQKELADFLGVSPASIATSLKRMSKAGFIERTEDEKDRRINRLRLSEKGNEIRLAGKAECDRVDKVMFSGFTDEEITAFSDMLSKVAKNLSPAGISEKEVFDIMKKRRNGDDKND